MKKFLVGLIIFFIIWIAIMIQINLLNILMLTGTIANIGIILVSALGLMCGKTLGAVIGFFYGLIIDILIGKSIGIYVLMHMLLGYICGILGKSFSTDNKTTLVAIVGIGTITFEIALYIMNIMVYDYELHIFAFAITVLKESIYNMLFAIILFKPLSSVSEIVNKSKDSYYLL